MKQGRWSLRRRLTWLLAGAALAAWAASSLWLYRSSLQQTDELFDAALVTVKTFFRILDVTYTGELVFSGIDEKGAITQHPDALQQAFLAGQKLVED